MIEHGVLVEHDHDLGIDEHTGEVLPCPPDCPHLVLDLDHFTTQLVPASSHPSTSDPQG